MPAPALRSREDVTEAHAIVLSVAEVPELAPIGAHPQAAGRRDGAALAHQTIVSCDAETGLSRWRLTK